MRATTLAGVALAVMLCGVPPPAALPSSKSAERIERLVVPPYLEEIVFDVFGASRGEVAIFAPGSARPVSTASSGVESVQLGSVLSTIVVRRPPPGTWIVRKTTASARVRIVSQRFFPRGLLVHPSQAEPLRGWDRIRIAYAVVDADGHRIQELPDYKFLLSLVLTRPDGAEEAFAMHRRRDAAGVVFATDRESDCSQPGRYWAAVRIATTDDAGRTVEVFRDRWSGFAVAPASANRSHARTALNIRFVPRRAGVVVILALLAVIIALSARVLFGPVR